MIGYGHFFITNDETVTYFRDEMGVIFVLGHNVGCQTSTGMGLMFQYYHHKKRVLPCFILKDKMMKLLHHTSLR